MSQLTLLIGWVLGVFSGRSRQVFVKVIGSHVCVYVARAQLRGNQEAMRLLEQNDLEENKNENNTKQTNLWAMEVCNNGKWEK